MNITLTNHQKRYRAPPGPVRKLCGHLRLRVESLRDGFRLETLSIVWLDDDRMRALNHLYFARATVTDVISFCYPPLPGSTGFTGELLVNLDQAWHEGRLRQGPDQELARYIAHGMHHLTGADDDTPARKRRMLAAEAAWVREAAAAGLVRGLLAPRTPPRPRAARKNRTP